VPNLTLESDAVPVKILLDTDIGSDIDDAVCLAYLLAQPDCELLGVTTVTGEAVERAKMVSALCKVAGRDVPVYPGLEQPIMVEQRQPRAPQAAALSRWDHDTDFPPGQAVEFLRRTIREHPGEITLLPIGPLTNVGLLFAVDPEIPSMLKALVMMCGVYTNRRPNVGPTEWNAGGDPHATALVFRADVARHRAVGLDVTSRVTMDSDAARKRFDTDLLRPVLDFAEIWFEQRDRITFHDPLAAATIFDDRICAFERGSVEVELAGERVKGMTHWTPGGPEGRHEVALGVDADRFFNHYFSVFP
jgi:inosine-uridine nucleoside N-ribohydrolase